jgi:fructose 1,6-bisphosphate aldolase/phosphatase
MPLVISKEILQRALAEHFAVGAFNANNFEPHRLPLEAMEYTTMPQVMEKFWDRFEDLGD